jgi:hypothetical protein
VKLGDELHALLALNRGGDHPDDVADHEEERWDDDDFRLVHLCLCIS